MKDQFGRTIDYLRVSVTDRCNLRCRYCMPESGVAWLPHERILRYEEILRLCRIFMELGVRNFRVTGGEPLARQGVETFIGDLKALDGAERVTVTTNGVELESRLPALIQAGLDGINLSLDTLNRARYAEITRRDALPAVLRGLDAAKRVPGLRLKLNCVAMADGMSDWIALAALGKDFPLSVRFIEPMPIGLGKSLSFCGEDTVRAALENAYGALSPDGVEGNGPARYFRPPGFAGTVGFISAVSRPFCADCNRVRLGATGFLKTCLQYGGLDLSPLLRRSDDEIREAIRETVWNKPSGHKFSAPCVENAERKQMNQIGG